MCLEQKSERETLDTIKNTHNQTNVEKIFLKNCSLIGWYKLIQIQISNLKTHKMMKLFGDDIYLSKRLL